MDDTLVYAKASGLKARQTNEDLYLLFDPKRDVLHELNSTSHAIFKAIDGQRNMREIIEHLSQDYGVPEHEIREDVLQVVDRFLKINIISPCSAAPGGNQ